MEIRRFFVKPSDLSGDVVTVRGEEFEHMTRVLRYKPGFKAYVLLNDGFERLCEITAVNRDSATLRVLETVKADERRAHLTLYAGLLKNNKLDFTVQKCVELGVEKIVPFTSSNCAETKFNRERSEKIALESAKQCGSAFLTEIGDLVTFEEVLDSFKSYSDVIFAYEFEKKNKIRQLRFNGSEIALVVGPEGGFTQAEAADAASYATVVTLGRRILRAETAGVVAAALTLDALGELDYD